ncbi:unnamed protein product [Protopolystoma xenopodis]|uniref:Uncharacterized protein n=1 Tax=Protopolystoma xenopodis TaxID=117903 RepID=A0A448WEB7_9PLAT|nr:unnamed protein product [Protopolystoma xenopodis]
MPNNLPPSHRGELAKFAYKVVLVLEIMFHEPVDSSGTSRLPARLTHVLQLPLRLLPPVWIYAAPANRGNNSGSRNDSLLHGHVYSPSQTIPSSYSSNPFLHTSGRNISARSHNRPRLRRFPPGTIKESTGLLSDPCTSESSGLPGYIYGPDSDLKSDLNLPQYPYHDPLSGSYFDTSSGSDSDSSSFTITLPEPIEFGSKLPDYSTSYHSLKDFTFPHNPISAVPDDCAPVGKRTATAGQIRASLSEATDALKDEIVPSYKSFQNSSQLHETACLEVNHYFSEQSNGAYM